MSTIGKRGVLGLSLSELIEAVAVIIGIVVLLGVTVKIIGILFNDPSEQFAKASYRGLVTDIKTLLQDGQQYSFDFVLYEKSDSFTLVGFDRDYSPYKLPSGWFGGSSYFPKPEQCEAYGDTACICLYKGKLKKVIECSSFNQNIDFVTLGKINGEELAGFDTKESKGIVYHELITVDPFPREFIVPDVSIEEKPLDLKLAQGALYLLTGRWIHDAIQYTTGADLPIGVDTSATKKRDRLVVEKIQSEDGSIQLLIDVLDEETYLYVLNNAKFYGIELEELKKQIDATADPQELFILYGKFVQKYSDTPEALGFTYYKKIAKAHLALERSLAGKHYTAILIYQRMIELYPDETEVKDGSVQQEIGDIYFNHKEYSKACAAYLLLPDEKIATDSGLKESSYLNKEKPTTVTKTETTTVGQAKVQTLDMVYDDAHQYTYSVYDDGTKASITLQKNKVRIGVDGQHKTNQCIFMTILDDLELWPDIIWGSIDEDLQRPAALMS